MIGGKNVGINPKINNMIQGYDVAKYELFMVSDAGLKSNSLEISCTIHWFILLFVFSQFIQWVLILYTTWLVL